MEYVLITPPLRQYRQTSGGTWVCSALGPTVNLAFLLHSLRCAKMRLSYEVCYYKLWWRAETGDVVTGQTQSRTSQ